MAPKTNKSYLKGKYVFSVSLIVILLTVTIVYLSGTEVNRTVFFNSYLSLGIIGFFLFFFMSYGLYTGLGILDDLPEYGPLTTKNLISSSPHGLEDLPSLDFDDGLGAIIASIIIWVIVSITLLVLFLFLAELFIFSLFFLLTILYWVFFRALKLVFSKSNETKNNLNLSLLYSVGYTILFTGWIFGLIFALDILK